MMYSKNQSKMATQKDKDLNGSLMKVESIAECSLGLTCIKRSVLKANFSLLLSGRLRQVLLHCVYDLFVS